MPEIRIKLNTTPAKVRRFFEKLGCDDAFRDRLETDPRKVLAQFGLEIPASAVPATFKLPPKSSARDMASRLGPDAFGKAHPAPLGFAVFVFFLGAPHPNPHPPPAPPPPTSR